MKKRVKQEETIENTKRLKTKKKRKKLFFL